MAEIKITKSNIDDYANRYKELKVMIKEFEEEVKEIQEALKAKTEAAGGEIVTDNYKLKISTRTRESVDVKKFKAEHPRLALKYVTSNTFDVFTVS